MARPSKPASVIKLEGKSHRTKKELRKQAKLDEEKTFDDIIKRGPSESAKRAFKHDVRNVYGVKQCLTKWGVDLKGAITDGQNNTN